MAPIIFAVDSLVQNVKHAKEHCFYLFFHLIKELAVIYRVFSIFIYFLWGCLNSLALFS